MAVIVCCIWNIWNEFIWPLQSHVRSHKHTVFTVNQINLRSTNYELINRMLTVKHLSQLALRTVDFSHHARRSCTGKGPTADLAPGDPRSASQWEERHEVLLVFLNLIGFFHFIDKHKITKYNKLIINSTLAD